MKNLSDPRVVRGLYSSAIDEFSKSGVKPRGNQFAWLKKFCAGRKLPSDLEMPNLFEAACRVGRIIGDLFAYDILHENSEKERLLVEIFRLVGCKGDSVEVRVGLGGSEDELSVRLASYLLPTLCFLRILRRHGAIVPKVRVIHAGRLSAMANGLDLKRVQRNTERSASILRKFVDEFFPDVASQVSVQLLSHGEIVDFRNSGFFTEALRALQEKEARKNIMQIFKNGRRYSSDQKMALEYAVCHLLIFGKTEFDAKNLIKFGGKGEVPFNEVQALIIESMATNGISHCFQNPVNVIGRAGAFPPYYLYEGDVSLDEAARVKTFGALVSHYVNCNGASKMVEDLHLIDRVIGGEQYLKFIHGVV